MLSAVDHPQVVDDYLMRETSVGRVGIVPQEGLMAATVHTSHFGVIPKNSKPEAYSGFIFPSWEQCK